jgi:hypothetical protein
MSDTCYPNTTPPLYSIRIYVQYIYVQMSDTCHQNYAWHHHSILLESMFNIYIYIYVQMSDTCYPTTTPPLFSIIIYVQYIYVQMSDACYPTTTPPLYSIIIFVKYIYVQMSDTCYLTMTKPIYSIIICVNHIYVQMSDTCYPTTTPPLYSMDHTTSTIESPQQLVHMGKFFWNIYKKYTILDQLRLLNGAWQSALI